MHIFLGLFSNRYYLLHHWCSFDKYFINLVCRDASWETGDAFADLHSQYSRCDAKRCTCPNGREHNETSGYGCLNIMWLIRAFSQDLKNDLVHTDTSDNSNVLSQVLATGLLFKSSSSSFLSVLISSTLASVIIH